MNPITIEIPIPLMNEAMTALISRSFRSNFGLMSP